MRQELSYQTGVTPESIEKARNHEAIIRTIPDEHKPLTGLPPSTDCKWRFFWPIGERPEELNNDLPKVVPRDFPMWEQKMDSWGNHMMDACTTAAEMSAVGLGLQADTFTEKMHHGAHLLSPTASDLMKYDVGTTFAGFHTDLNFITVHGKSRYPGLFLWTRDFKKMACKVPQGCLLMQAGMMFEHITGGYVLAGFHEVVYHQSTKDTRDRFIKERDEQGIRHSTWRISSTLFSHLRYDVDLTPLKEMNNLYDDKETELKYPPKTSFELLCDELRAINLAPKQSYASASATETFSE